jgi:hypothetical protein
MPNEGAGVVRNVGMGLPPRDAACMRPCVQKRGPYRFRWEKADERDALVNRRRDAGATSHVGYRLARALP